MEKKKNFVENKLATTMGSISFTEQEIVAQSDVEKIGSVIDVLVVEIDQQKYEDFLFSGSENLIEMRHYHRVIAKTHKSSYK